MLGTYAGLATHKCDALKDNTMDNMSTPFKLNNAGLVLLHSYTPMLFSRLALTENDTFVSAEAQQRAVHYLQFLVTGHMSTPDHYLALNKILCGLKPQEPVVSGIIMPAAEVELCESLLQAAINHWSAIGSSSLDGFRGNWLVRDGLLSEQTGQWDMTVDKRAYDLLLNRSPFSYSIIKMPWMSKALHVTWPT